MNKTKTPSAAPTKIEHANNRTARAEARTARAETRTEHAEARADAAETRTEQAETRTESAKTRTEQAETRAEQAETRAELCEETHKKLQPIPADSPDNDLVANGFLTASSLERLTPRQREILQLIAHGRNTKEIGGALTISPKTVEYHRMKLMKELNLHDIPSLVRFAIKTGLVSMEA